MPGVIGLAGLADVLKSKPPGGVLEAGRSLQACYRLDVGDRAVEVRSAPEHGPRHHSATGRFIGRYNQTARPFNWKFTAADLTGLLQRLSARHEPASLPEAA